MKKLYVAEWYGLRYLSTSAVNAAAEPAPAKLAELVKLMRLTGSKYVEQKGRFRIRGRFDFFSFPAPLTTPFSQLNLFQKLIPARR
jgi:hypothetical protein